MPEWRLESLGEAVLSRHGIATGSWHPSYGNPLVIPMFIRDLEMRLVRWPGTYVLWPVDRLGLSTNGHFHHFDMRLYLLTLLYCSPRPV